MPEYNVNRKLIVVFHTGDEYLFSHYFDRQDIFRDLSDYYNDEQYRFEVPATDFESVQQQLEDAYYKLRIIEDLESYCVVTEKYDKHADILRESIATWERRGHRFFLMKSKLAVKEAIDQGANRVSETDFALGI